MRGGGGGGEATASIDFNTAAIILDPDSSGEAGAHAFLSSAAYEGYLPRIETLRESRR